jgi:hypothetical protein
MNIQRPDLPHPETVYSIQSQDNHACLCLCSVSRTRALSNQLHPALNGLLGASLHKATDRCGLLSTFTKMLFHAITSFALFLVAAAVTCPVCPTTDLAGDALVAQSGGTRGTPLFCGYVTSINFRCLLTPLQVLHRRIRSLWPSG